MNTDGAEAGEQPPEPSSPADTETQEMKLPHRTVAGVCISLKLLLRSSEIHLQEKLILNIQDHQGPDL